METEEWRSIDGTNGKYEVSSLGRVRNAERGTILKTQNKHGYRRLNIPINGKSKNCSVHRLVAKAFIPNPYNKPEVNHKDGVKDNNRVGNLEWVTSSENWKHAADNDLMVKGIEAAKILGKDRFNKKDKPKAYLRKSELINKVEYGYLVDIAENHEITIGRLAFMLHKVIEGKKVRLNDNKSDIILNEDYVESLLSPYKNKIRRLEDELQQALDMRKLETDLIRKNNIGMDDDMYAIGNKNNYLEIIGYAYDWDNKLLVCKCDCGNVKLVGQTQWKTGKVKSCGCMHDQLSREANPGDERKQDWLYTLWCRQHRNPIWYEGWSDYNTFYEWAYANGYSFGRHLHRMDIGAPFSPENCEWKDKQQQVGNKVSKPRYLVNGEMLTVIEACTKYGILDQTVRYRMKRGLTLEEAINTPKCSNGRKINKLHLKSEDIAWASSPKSK